MNIITGAAAKRAAETATQTVEKIRKAADEEILVSRKEISLKIAVALLGGIVLGMLISPRKKVSYKIASENHDIGGGEFSVNKPHDEEEDEDFDEDDNDYESDDDRKHGKFIKL
jgi:hypothetical protein